MIQHVVVMKFGDEADVAEAVDKLNGMVGVVDEIQDLHVHRDTLGSPTGHHLLLRTTHTDEAGLRAYQAHPAHQEVAGWLREHLADRAVVDWTD